MASPNDIKLSFYGVQLTGNISETEEEWKNLPANLRAEADEYTRIYCRMYQSHELYKKDEKSQTYEVCCKWYNYCSFTNEIWFWPACIGAGFILLNLISIAFLCLICRKKGGRSAGGLDEEEKEVEEIDNNEEEDNDDN